MTRKFGFTLIELLVVIAIIAILAAIIFPVFMKAKEAAYRSGDLSNMNAIRNALQLYRADQEAYPPQILGYATVYASGTQMNQIIPASQLRLALYPRRIDSLQTTRPAYDRNADSLVTSGTIYTGTTTVAVGTPGDSSTVRWPNADPRLVNQNPILDLNGDGIINGQDDPQQARQAYGPDVFFCAPPPPGQTSSCVMYGTNNASDATPLYKISGYDAAQVKLPNGDPRWELRYALRWTTYAMNGGNRQDDPRQLVYNEPPDTTVITWNSWFRDYDPNNLPTHSKKDFVLFLGGGARPFDSADVSARSWRIMP